MIEAGALIIEDQCQVSFRSALNIARAVWEAMTENGPAGDRGIR